VSYASYLRWEGGCSIVLGSALALVAAPGLFVSYPAWWTGLLFIPAALLALGGWARWRHGVPLTAPGRWLTERPLRDAAPDRAPLDAGRVRRRLVIETAIWIVAVCAWVIGARESGLLVFGTGLASAAFGVVQAVFAARHVTGQRGDFMLARRPGLGTPDLQRCSVAP
jgi:hypothetical protein